MKRIIKKKIIAGILVMVVAVGCKQVTNKSEQESRQSIPVTVSMVSTGQINSYLELSATSSFLFKATIKTPVTGYIDNIHVNQGDAIEKNQLLFTVRTKEASALLGDTIKNLAFSGIVKVKAVAGGFISSIEHPQGDYVAEGDQFCQVAIPESFAFILDVPFELSRYVKPGTYCNIILPDNTSLKGIIKSRFSSMAASSQTERFILKLVEPKNLPENLTAKIQLLKETVKAATSLPKASILTNETMQEFWVMKLINDSMAIKVPVLTGISEGNNVQIIRPVFNDSDLFLDSGNFGLGDTAYVKVTKTPGR